MSQDLPPDHEPAARDAWLSEALRHAPDADAAPPAALRQAILAQARAAAVPPRPSPAAALWARIDAWWGWLAQPPVAAGLASVALSSVLGVMWWSGLFDEAALPEPTARTAEVARVTAPPASSVGSPAAAPAEPPSAHRDLMIAPSAARRRQASAAAAPPPAPEAFAKAQAPESRADAPSQQPAAKVAEATAGMADQTAAAAERRARALPPRVATAAPPPAAVATTADKAEVAPQAAPAVDRMAEPQRSRIGAQAEAARAPAGLAAPAAAPMGALRSLAAPPADPLQSAMALIASQPATLQWAAAGRRHAHGSAQQAWFDALRSATAGRWQRGAGANPGDAGAIELFDGATLRATVRVSSQSVSWADPATGLWQAPLTPAESATLRVAPGGW